MSGFILNELLDKLPNRNTSDASRFGSTLSLRIATADAKHRTVIYEYEVTEDEIFHGYLASGWLATIMDHATEPLVCLAAPTPDSYSTALNVHTLEPVLPGTRIEIASKYSTEFGKERSNRTGEDITTMRRRLQYQMRKRGILETDLLLSTFASEHLQTMSLTELADLDVLLSNIDWDIFYWATKKTVPPEAVSSMPVFQKLVEHAAKRGNTIVRMPDLEDASKQQ
ncbi:Succinate dehydrogenase assembly factor 2 mitochondrial [Coemansia sp. RSA 1933]|nr:Succinate dehydrogenase assembly factor 2 mitochondrial [Coemansia sp. RSA 1933]